MNMRVGNTRYSAGQSMGEPTPVLWRLAGHRSCAALSADGDLAGGSGDRGAPPGW